MGNDYVRKSIATFIFTVWCSGAWALGADEITKLAIGESDGRIAVLNAVVSSGDQTALPFLQNLLDDQVKIAGSKVYLVSDGNVSDPATGQALTLPENAEDVVNNNRMRGELESAIATLNLFSKDRLIRLEAAKFLQGAEADDGKLALIQKIEQAELDKEIRDMLVQVRASIQLNSQDKAIRLIAVRTLGESSNSNVKQMLSSRLAVDGETDPEVRAAVEKALLNIDRNLAAYEYAGLVFTGISLGSILLLVALGLAITYGLMGIINMAHGEMIMIGAYTTFMVQNLFRNYLPEQFQWYLLVAIPAAFIVTALVGILLERSVLRFLYNRPLESLLATWGISLMLMQLARSLFGAQNVAVENPAWMSGGIEVAANLVLPYSRIGIILFAATVLLLIWMLLTKTRLGLFVRAVTQNRQMASCVGVHTGKVDTLAFGLGSGVAGLAGVALSQIGNVGPDLGQQYIVDSFMVVVLGGVGQLAGAAYAAMGLGIFSKFLEGSVGAVLAKIIVLVCIIIFIQKRPQGIFALKGRAVDA